VIDKFRRSCVILSHLAATLTITFLSLIVKKPQRREMTENAALDVSSHTDIPLVVRDLKIIVSRVGFSKKKLLSKCY